MRQASNEIKESFRLNDQEHLNELLKSGDVDQEGSREEENNWDIELQNEEVRGKKIQNEENIIKAKHRPWVLIVGGLLCLTAIILNSCILYLSIFGGFVLHHTFQCGLLLFIGGSGYGLFKIVFQYYFNTILSKK